MNRRTSTFVTGLVVLSFSVGTSAADFGRTEGEFAVSPTGAAAYSIPISIPPGPRGMQPSISLEYNSQGGRGLAGVGWNLSAGSVIERCKQTKAQDSAPAYVVLLAMTDKFCLDGKRLRVTSGLSTYGQPNSTYQTEIADFSLITAYGTEGSGPQYFEVKDKSGLIFEYGKTDDSRVKPGVSPTVLRWMLNRVRDRSGNNYVIEYKKETGFAAPKKISWTPHYSGAPTYRYTAEFSYIDDTIKNSIQLFVAGQPITNRNRLEGIAIASDGVVIRRYELSYLPGPTTQASRLSQITECATADSSNCFLPTLLTYQAGQPGITPANVVTPTGSSNSIVRSRYDLNGDGKGDIAFKSGSLWYVAFGENNGFSSPYSTGISNTATTLLIDRFLPNGRDAIVVPGNPMTVVSWNDATAAFVSFNTGVNHPTTLGTILAADYDGDRLADLVTVPMSSAGLTVRRNTSSSASSNPSFASSTTGTAVLASAGHQWSRAHSKFDTGLVRSDVNGDGRQDIYGVVKMQVNQNTWAEIYSVVLLGTASGFQIGPPWNSGPPPGAMNFNGDACTDRWNASGGGYTIAVAACDGFATTSVTAPAIPLQLLDWDGDSRTDLLVNNGGNFGVYLSTGNGFSGLITTSIPSSGVFFTVDQDGDKLDDLIKVNGTSPINYWTHTATGTVPAFATGVPDLLSTITDGFGVSHSVSYVSTASSYYTKTGTAVYPLQESDPRIVVAQLSTTDGIGGTFSKSYHYTAARQDASRDSFAGFQKIRETDSRNLMIRDTTYEQAFPFAGNAKLDEVFQTDGTAVSRIESEFLPMPIDPDQFNARVFAHVKKVTKTRREVGGTKNGQPITTSATEYTDVDAANGNIRKIETVLTDVDSAAPASPTQGMTWTTTIQLQFSPDTTPANWCLGVPTSTTTTQASTAPGSTTVVRRTDLTPDYAKCRVARTILEPLSTTHKVTTDIEYDDDPGVAQPDFGNITKTTVTGIGMAQRVSNVTWTTTGQFPLTMSNALNHQESFGYDFALGLETSETDANGLVTSTEYDAFGRQKKVTRPDGTASLIRRVDCAAYPNYCTGNRRGIIWYDELDTGGNVVKSDQDVIDRLGRPIQRWTKTLNSAANELYSMVATNYDAFGRVVSRSAPCLSGSCGTQYFTNFTYDLVGRPKLITRPLSAGSGVTHTTSIAYKGATTETTDAQNKVITQVSDPNGWRRRLRDHNNYGQDFRYDGAGSLLDVTDSGGVPLLTNVLYVYGLAAFQTQATDANMGPRTKTYNALGELVAWTDARGQSFSATFDDLSRPLTRFEPDQRTFWVWGSATDNSASAKYIGSVRDVRTETPSGVQTYKDIFAYDGKGRLAQHTVSIPGEGNFTYDYAYNATLGLLESVEFPSTVGTRPKMGYQYQFGYLQKVTDGAASPIVYWEAKKTNELHAVIEEALGNNLTTKRSYDSLSGNLNWIRTGVTNSGNDTSVQNLAYLYDYVGNVAQRQDGALGLTEDFYYDDLYRLDYSTLRTGGGSPVINADFSYAPNGNVLSRLGGTTFDYTTPRVECVNGYYPTHAQPHAMRSSASDVPYCYDANGNMTRRGAFLFDWTSYNYPSHLRGGGGQSAQFSYGPDRQRWKMIFTNGATLETTLYIGPGLEKVTVGTDTVYRHTISADGTPIALLTRTSSGADTLRYLLGDHQGSVEKITTSGGGIEARESFTEFGMRRNPLTWAGYLSSTEAAALDSITRQGYTFQTVLGSMGLTHMNGRVVENWSGRFISADPFVTHLENTQNFNRYGYVYNNPLTLTDPSGFSAGGSCYPRQDGSQIVYECPDITTTGGGDPHDPDSRPTGASPWADPASAWSNATSWSTGIKHYTGDQTPQLVSNFTPADNISVRAPWFVIPHGLAVQLTPFVLPSDVAAEMEADAKKGYALAAIALLPTPVGKTQGIMVFPAAAGGGIARGSFILSGLGKMEAKEVAKRLGYTPAQVQKLLSAVKRATTSSVVHITRNGPNVVVQIFRAGRDGGFQVMRTEVGMNGALKTVQIAYDRLGKLVHYDPKGGAGGLW